MKLLIVIVSFLVVCSASFAQVETFWKCPYGSEGFLGHHAKVQIGHPNYRDYFFVEIFRREQKVGEYLLYFDGSFTQHSHYWRGKVARANASYNEQNRSIEMDFYSVNMKGSFKYCTLMR